MNRLLLLFSLSIVSLHSYGQEDGSKSLHYYIETAKENSPLIADYRNRTEIEQAELERLKAMYTHSRLELNGDYLDDERSNLDIQLSRPILVVGDLGLWHGRRMGYKEIPSGNIRDCLYSERDMDYSTWYVDKNGDFRCDAIHHDGTHDYLYRTYKDRVSDTQIESLKEKLYRGIATRADITRVTRRLGDEIAHVYGFPIPRRQAPVQER